MKDCKIRERNWLLVRKRDEKRILENRSSLWGVYEGECVNFPLNFHRYPVSGTKASICEADPHLMYKDTNK